MLRSLNKLSDQLYRRRVGAASVLIEPSGTSIMFRQRNAAQELISVSSLDQIDLSGGPLARGDFEGALCKVALPDPDFYFHPTKFSQLPSKPEAARKFLAWRLKEELGDVQEGCEVAFGQVDLKKGSCPTLLCKADSKKRVFKSLEALGGRAECLLPTGFYVLSYLWSSNALADICGTQIVVLLWKDYWTCLGVDENGRLLHMRSCSWSDAMTRENELADLLADFCRLVPSRISSSDASRVMLLGDASLCRQFETVAKASLLSACLLEGGVFDDNEIGARQRFLLSAVGDYEH